MSEPKTRPLLELLVKVNHEVATALDLRTVLQRLLFAALQYVGGERGSIVVVDDSGKPVDATIVYGKQFHDHTTQQLRETIEKGLAGWVVQNRKPALVPDTSKDDRWVRRADDASDKSGAKSAICVPLIAREKLVGVLTLVHPIPNSFNDDHLELMQAISDQASIAVLNARLYSETQRTARIMSALAEGAAAINTSLEMPDVLRRILNQTMTALQVDTVALALIDSKDDLVFQAAAGNHSGSITGTRIKLGEGSLLNTVIEDQEGVVVPYVKFEPRFSDEDKLDGIEMRAVAIAPIQANGKVIGVLEAINPLAGHFDPDALVVMTGLGSLAGTTIQNATLFESLNKAHQHYRDLFEDSVDMIFITDWDGKILEANRQAIDSSAYTLSQLQNLTINKLHQINTNKTGLNFETLRRNESCMYESALLRQDGIAIYIDVYVRHVDYDSVKGLQWIFKDATARKELDEMRDDMTSMIFHDLRSPLGNIVSSIEMMDPLIPQDEMLHSMLGIAKSSAARIQRLVNSLLDINRLEEGQQIIEQNAISPRELIRLSLVDIETNANARHQNVINNTTNLLPHIWVDTDMIYRVFVNLLENAIKFTPVNGTIEVGGQTSSDKRFVKFWVKDSGRGIQASDQERIFEKFTRVRGKNRPGGLGVGLAFCKMAVNGHGGEIWVESELDKGTTFWLTLPVAEKPATGQLKKHTGRLSFKPDKKNE